MLPNISRRTRTPNDCERQESKNEVVAISTFRQWRHHNEIHFTANLATKKLRKSSAGNSFQIVSIFPKGRTLIATLGLVVLAVSFSGTQIALHIIHRHQIQSLNQALTTSETSQAADDDEAAPTVVYPSRVQLEEGMVAGLPFRDPPDLNSSTPKNLVIHLVAKRTLFNISGKQIWGESYNGEYVGPTMHFLPGENVTLDFKNDLKTATNLHFHGMHLSPNGSSDNPYITVEPGHTFVYHLAIPKDQPVGTFWYHDHEMCMGTETMSMPGMPSMSTKPADCDDLESQIFAGLSGTIVVGDDRQLLPKAFAGVAVHTIVLKDLQTNNFNKILQNSSNESINSSAPTVRLVNGELRPVLTMQPGQTQLWRFANEGADIFYDLTAPGFTFTIIGQDGYPAAKITTANTLLLPPAKRFDVLVTAPKSPTTTWLETLTYHQGDDTYPTEDLMKVDITGPAMKPIPLASNSVPTAETSLANAHISQYRTVTLNENAAGTLMYINGKGFDMNRSVFSKPAILGTVEQWTILNTTPEIHPFHTHTDHFQVMSINGVVQPYIGEQDIVPVPQEVNGVPGKVVIRIHFTDFIGKLMFHCHIAAHEDAGMMSFINVVRAPEGQTHMKLSRS